MTDSSRRPTLTRVRGLGNSIARNVSRTFQAPSEKDGAFFGSGQSELNLSLATPGFDPLSGALKQEVDDRRSVEREGLREQKAADNGDAQRTAQLGAGAESDGEREGAEKSSHSGHHDGPKPDDAGFVNGIAR